MRFFLLVFLICAAPALAQTGGAPGKSGYVSGNQASLQEQISNAEDGDVGSQYNLGMRYATGAGVPQDYAAALRWLEMAGNHGDVDAQAAVGVMYQKGQGTGVNEYMAANWYKRAAMQGDRMSAYNLAAVRANATGSFRDDKEAYFWTLIASTMGDAKVASLQGVLLARMSPEDIKAAEQRAAGWQPEPELDPARQDLLEPKREGP